MPKTFSRKYRILLTRIFAVLLIGTILTFETRWQDGSLVSGSLFLLGVVLIGVAVVGRLWCALYISGYKSNTLITTGPYSISRNPLYFFSFLGAIGIGLTTECFTLPIFITVCFAILYPAVIKSEENKLAGLYKEVHAEYCKKTPIFFPNFKLLKEPEEYVVKPIIFRKATFEVLWFVWMLGLIEFSTTLHDAHVLPILFKLY